MQTAHHIRVRLKARVPQNINGGPGYCIVGLFILGALVDILKFTDGVVVEHILYIVEVQRATSLVQRFAGLAGFGLLLCTFLQTICNCMMLVLMEGGLAIALADRTMEQTDTRLNFYGWKVVLPPGPPASNAIIIAVAVLPITIAANLVGRHFKFIIAAIGLRPLAQQGICSIDCLT